MASKRGSKASDVRVGFGKRSMRFTRFDVSEAMFDLAH